MPAVDDPDERFPLVDERGRAVGTATRAACHADPSLVHPSVHVVVLAPGGMLWQLRGPYKDTAPGAWDHACSGHVGVGESPDQAALRELQEELGVRVAAGALEPLGRLLVRLPSETELTSVYRLRHDGPFTIHPPELGGIAILEPGRRPDPLSPSCVLLCRRLDAEHPGWDAG